ncbi:hypothetical protein [Nocardia brasiliensis]|uniref:hypothetical protein n=1 Tax=Nocardia brasiliensis TaxID=37326 RepID=UPI0024590CE0|nr:hypothetical protein [Nocardia brasiliensis]
MAKIVTAHRVVACRDGRATPIAVSKLLLHSNNRSIAARDRSSSRLVGISTARAALSSDSAARAVEKKTIN